MKVLISCYEAPGYGGASTTNYSLYDKLKKDNLPVAYLNLISDFEVDFYRYQFGEQYANPKNLKDVHTSILRGDDFYTQHVTVLNQIENIKPDVIMATGFITAMVIKNSAPDIPLVYMTNSCRQVRSYIQAGKAKTAIDLLNDLKKLRWKPHILVKEEEIAVDSADLILTHSNLTRDFYNLFFPKHMGKIYQTVFWRASQIIEDTGKYSSLAKPFDQRSIDVLFVASDWSRLEKNYPYVEKIIEGLPGRNIHIVGNYPYSIPGVTYYGLISEVETLYGLMGTSKTLVCPSVFDAAPAVLFEGAVMGCNVVSSRNCGNWSLCNSELLVEEFSTNIFIEKIIKALYKKFPDHINEYNDLGDREDLFNLLLITADTLQSSKYA